MKHSPKIKISLPTIIFVGLIVFLDRSHLSLIAFFAAIIHELGHLAAMRLLGAKVREIEITFFGAEIRTPSPTKGTLRSIIIFASGAAANILSAIIAYSFPNQTPELSFFAGASLSLAVINLLPIRTLDGGSILEATLMEAIPNHAVLIIDIISSLTLAILWLTAVYLLLVFGGNLSLMLFCMYLFFTLAFGNGQ